MADEHSFHAYRRRLPHWRLRDSVYFVTWRLHEEQRELSPAERDTVCNALRHANGERYALYAYVVMDDHVHAILAPWAPLEEVVQAWKSYTAHVIRRREPLWQREYFDRIIRDREEYKEKLHYVLNNPFKRWPELKDYPWTGVFAQPL